jgi:hypothetical protein
MEVEGDNHWNYVELPDKTRRKMSREEIHNHSLLPKDSTPIQLVSLYPAGLNATGLFPFTFRGKTYRPPAGNSWLTNEIGMKRIAEADRIEPYEDGQTFRAYRACIRALVSWFQLTDEMQLWLLRRHVNEFVARIGRGWRRFLPMTIILARSAYAKTRAWPRRVRVVRSHRQSQRFATSLFLPTSSEPWI